MNVIVYATLSGRVVIFNVLHPKHLRPRSMIAAVGKYPKISAILTVNPYGFIFTISLDCACF